MEVVRYGDLINCPNCQVLTRLAEYWFGASYHGTTNSRRFRLDGPYTTTLRRFANHIRRRCCTETANYRLSQGAILTAVHFSQL